MFKEGQKIGVYTLIRKLGRGGFGEVWLAEKRSQFVTKKVAVKLPHDDQVNFDSIRQEATLWEEASGHPNVLPIIDAEEYDGQVVIVSEYASGGSLADKLKSEGKLSIEQAIEMIMGVLSGLEYLHSKKIIHRDIKPQNILLQGETPRLSDFGISRAMQTTAISSTIIGTDAYMSPEAYQGVRSIQTDIWSVGVVLYQLLNGYLPFPQEHPSERMYAILQRDFDPLPMNVPQNLKNIVEKALAKLPENRYQTANEMREELRQILHKETNLSVLVTHQETDINSSDLPKKTPLSKISSETRTILKPKSSSNFNQLKTSSPEPKVFEHQSKLEEYFENKPPTKPKPKKFSTITFASLCLVALFLVLIVLLGIRIYENQLRNEQKADNLGNSRNTIISNTLNPIKETITPKTTKRAKSNNSNVDALNTQTAKAPQQMQDTNAFSKQEEQALMQQVKVANQRLQNEMLRKAQEVSSSRHKSSNLEECYSSESDIVFVNQTQYDRTFKCRLKGKILGIRSFEVGVIIRGEITPQGDNFIGRILNTTVIYDREL